MEPFTYFLIWAATFIIGELLRPKPNIPDAQAAGLEDLNFPTAEDGRPITVIFGKVLAAAPNVVWYGDFNPVPITQKVSTGLFSSERVIIGFHYHVGMHLVLCAGAADSITSIRFADTEVWAGIAMDEIISVNEPTIFGGDAAGGEGGVVGDFEILSGDSGQPVNDYLLSVIDDPEGIPAYRGVTSLILRGVNIGTSPYIKPISVEMTRYPTALGSGYPKVGPDLEDPETWVDANPAEMLYEIMTNADWGMSRVVSEFDVAVYQAAAETLFNESMGLSYKWGGIVTFEAMLGQVLRHIGAVQFAHPSTGRFHLTLIRKDFDPDAILLLDDSNVDALSNFTRGAFDETTNEVKVTYNSRANDYSQATAIAHDIANWKVQGRIVSSTQSFDAVYDDTLASRITFRELKQMSYPRAAGELVVNREGHDLLPGSVFKFNWPELGITNLIMRVAKVDYGTLLDGKVTVSATQDVFSLSEAIYAPPPQSQFISTSTHPTNAPYQTLLEAPYLAHQATTTEGRYLPLASPPQAGLFYGLWERVGADPYLEVEGSLGFNDHALVESNVAPQDTTIRIKNLRGPNASDITVFNRTVTDMAAGENIAVIGSEWVSFSTLTLVAPGVYELGGTVWRGVLDTTPKTHSVDTTVWLIAEGSYVREFSFAEAVAVNAKITPQTTAGVLDLADAPDLSLTLRARAYRAYPMGNVQVNDLTWPQDPIDADIDLSWSHRSRIAQGTTVVSPTNATDFGPEAGTTYTVEIYGEAGTLLRTVTGLTGKTYTYDLATEQSDTGLSRRQQTLTFRLYAVRDGYTSWQYHERIVQRTPQVGYGTDYGQIYGGE